MAAAAAASAIVAERASQKSFVANSHCHATLGTLRVSQRAPSALPPATGPTVEPGPLAYSSCYHEHALYRSHVASYRARTSSSERRLL
eukprot:COSAG06_NODE_1690_length_8706_cov_4.248170_4_plen_88_part_00